MFNQIKQIAATERRISSIFLDLRGIIREHNRLFPQSGRMLVRNWRAAIPATGEVVQSPSMRRPVIGEVDTSTLMYGRMHTNEGPVNLM
jgi:hypothetical protein